MTSLFLILAGANTAAAASGWEWAHLSAGLAVCSFGLFLQIVIEDNR